MAIFRSSEIEVRLDGLGRVHVHDAHEPAGLVRAYRQKRQIDRAEPRADLAKEIRVSRVAGEEEAANRHRRTKPPQSARLRSNGVRAEKCCAGVSMIGNGAELDRLLPPIQLLHASNPADRTRRPLPSGVMTIGSNRRASFRSVVRSQWS